MLRAREHLVSSSRPAIACAALAAVASVPGPVDEIAFAEPVGYRYEAAATCTDIVNETLAGPRLAAMTAGAEAQLEVVKATVGSAELPDLATATEAVAAHRDAIGEIVDALRSFDPTDAPTTEQSAAWDVIVNAGDELLTALDARHELLATGDLARVTAEFSPFDGAGEIGDDAIGTLANADDCLLLYRLAEWSAISPFQAAAAAECRYLKSLFTANNLRADQDAVLEVLAELYEGDGTLAPREPDVWPVAEARRIAAYHHLVAERLSAVAEGADAPAEWADVVAYFAEFAAALEARAEAMEAGDLAAIAETFQQRPAPHSEHLEATGLHRRACGRLPH